MGRKRFRAVACALAAVLVLASCGGDDDDTSSDEVEETGGALGDAGDFTTGDGGESYVPTGELIADSGFRPDVNGFSFANYGNDVGPQNLTPANVEALFGEQVCVAGTGVDCILTPAGEKWMETQNEIMDGGHCMGFSVASLRMFAETLDPTAFGGEIANELPLEGNVDLQATIAQSFVYQMLPTLNENSIKGTPNEIVDALIELINAGEDYYTLGFYKADGSGGHAVTPLAIEDKGDGQFAILIYDNNYPDMIRAIEVDTERNYFSYNGSPNPDIAEGIYEGDESTPPMVLFPTLIGEEQHACPFCDGELLEGGDESLGSALPAEDQYAEVALVGDNANHPHLIFTDTEDESKQAGLIDGELVNDIEGLEIIQQFTDDPSYGAPEPKFRLPLDKDVTITIDGSDLTDVATEVAVTYTAPGKVVEIDDITVAPGQQDTMLISAESYTIVYESNNEEGVAPTFFAGVDEADASYTLGATVVGVAPGSLLAMAILEDAGQVLFDLSDAVAVEGVEMTSILAISKLDDSGEHAWINEGVVIDTAGVPEDVYLNYHEQELTPGSPIGLEIGREGGPFRVVPAAYTEG